MLKIRLQRVGKKNSPSYRVVLAEHTAPPQGKFQEILGFYNPRTKQKSFKKERIEHWLSKGAQLSPTVYNLLVDEKVFAGPKLKAWRPKKRSEAKSAEVPQQRDEGGKKEEQPQGVEVSKKEAGAKERPVEKKMKEPKEEIKEDKRLKPEEKPKEVEKVEKEKPKEEEVEEKPVEEKKEEK